MARISRIHLDWKRKVQAGLAPYGISPKQIHLLKLLELRGFLHPAEIAEALWSDRPTVTAFLGVLAKAGWVAFEPDPEDGRRKRVVLAPGGAAVLARVPPGLWRSDALDEDPADRLEPGERAELYRLLGKLAGRDQGGTDGERGSEV